MKGRLWRKEDDEYLAENYISKSVPALAKKLNRSESAIRKRGEILLGTCDPANLGGYVSFRFICRNILSINPNKLQDLWIQQNKFPVHLQRYNSGRYKGKRMVLVSDFWEWASDHRRMINWRIFKEGDMGAEPEWTNEYRRAAFKLAPNAPLKKAQLWSAEDDKRLQELIKTFKYTLKDIAQILGRTEGAITHRCENLNLTIRPLASYDRQLWSDEDTMMLLDFMKRGYTPEFMAAHMKRSMVSIIARIYRICPQYMSDKYKVKTFSEVFDIKLIDGIIKKMNIVNASRISLMNIVYGDDGFDVMRQLTSLFGGVVRLTTKNQRCLKLAYRVQSLYLIHCLEVELNRKIELENAKLRIEINEEEVRLFLVMDAGHTRLACKNRNKKVI